jgi:RNA polymerase sigma-70 factor (ECF subfamily)
MGASRLWKKLAKSKNTFDKTPDNHAGRRTRGARMADRAATFDALLMEHGAALRATIRRLCRRPQDVDDVWQETAVRVWRSLSGRPWLRSPRGWLATIAYRAWVEHASRNPAPASAAAELPDGRTLEPEELATRAELRTMVRQALEALPDDLRAVVALHYTASLSLREVAAALGIPAGTAKSRLHAALNLLRKEFA